jgi:hypothetical protein
MFTLNRAFNELKEMVIGHPIPADITQEAPPIHSNSQLNSISSEPVILHIYSISDRVNRFSLMLGLGLYHTAVEVYGQEHSFVGHPYKFTGIVSTIPKTAAYIYQEGLDMGQTKMTEHAVGTCLKELGKTFTGNSYHLIQNK